MAWNPSPKVAAARDFARKYNKVITIIVSLDTESIEVTSFGKTRRQCDEAKIIGDMLYNAVYDYFSDETGVHMEDVEYSAESEAT